MEEMLGNIAGARQVFERWMEWQPEEQAWHSYINFELRYKEVERARTIYERYILWMRSWGCHCPGRRHRGRDTVFLMAWKTGSLQEVHGKCGL